jgi:DMSO/TMAO reductase YedYZ heme-binding membrane subunit
MSFLKRIIFDGKIPGRIWIQRILIALAALTPLIWFFPEYWEDFGEYTWQILVVIMLVRPLANVFPKIRLFMALVPLRKELGILCASMVLAHGVGFYLSINEPIIAGFFDWTYWTFDDNQGYAHVGAILAIILLITSNTWSQKILKRNWKRIQYLAYAFFLTGGIHAVLAKGDDHLFYLAEMIIVWIVWMLAYFKVVLWKRA